MYIGGAQKRPDAPYARSVISPSGNIVGQVGEGNRKDIREAVEAAHKAAPGYVLCRQCLHLGNYVSTLMKVG
jgi:aldehyde dehydrogenase (NAD+)